MIDIDPSRIAKARSLAEGIATDVHAFIDRHTTVSVERSVLRLYGVDGAHKAPGVEIPLVNVVVEAARKAGRLGDGIASVLAAALQADGGDPMSVATKIAAGKIDVAALPALAPAEVERLLAERSDSAIAVLHRCRSKKKEKLAKYGDPAKPYNYVIVATGNIFEDVIQARAAVDAGADIIAVIRSTAQSLLDYVPIGTTTTGFGGTWATRENFRVMRKALDEEEAKRKKYIRLTNYSSGLCMSEIAVLAAFEDLDVLLNDSMYGILFRDINMKRTFVDQFFSRLICANAGIMIQTGEDNYLTTAESFDAFHQVVASQFINESFAHRATLPDELIGLGHAYEMDPAKKQSFLLELGQALLVRECFPDAPLKYMPPTRHMTGDVFFGHVYDSFFTLTTVWAKQTTQLIGMLTEAIHTPLLQDRYLSISAARYVQGAAAGIADEVTFKKDGVVQTRAREVLEQAVALLEEVKKIGLMEAIAKARFADVKRPVDGGKGLDGVVAKTDGYANPLFARMVASAGANIPGASSVIRR
jgi:beta-lysine 5,6-aminomutase alpha subunit